MGRPSTEPHTMIWFGEVVFTEASFFFFLFLFFIFFLFFVFFVDTPTVGVGVSDTVSEVGDSSDVSGLLSSVVCCIVPSVSSVTSSAAGELSNTWLISGLMGRRDCSRPPSRFPTPDRGSVWGTLWLCALAGGIRNMPGFPYLVFFDHSRLCVDLVLATKSGCNVRSISCSTWRCARHYCKAGIAPWCSTVRRSVPLSHSTYTVRVLCRAAGQLWLGQVPVGKVLC